MQNVKHVEANNKHQLAISQWISGRVIVTIKIVAQKERYYYHTWCQCPATPLGASVLSLYLMGVLASVD